MKIKYKTNLIGYLPILRGIQLLLTNHSLNFAQLGAYICFVTQADFDKRHENYRVILRDDLELAKAWSCNSVTVYRQRKQLIKKGLLTEENGLTKITNFYLFELEWVKLFAKLPTQTLQTLFTQSQEKLTKEQFSNAETQDNQDQKTTQSSNTSYKGELGLSDEDIRDISSMSSEEVITANTHDEHNEQFDTIKKDGYEQFTLY